ncbi:MULTISPECIES: hypothetical protein [Pseudomonas]|jgi:hypothetical protein|uniref:Uncharacterized protein n=1 Tax=Pseudomonas cremoris TaxID=2724178 RepID=A0ABR6TDF5_9PSED|nr:MULTISPECIES: hypothetical protein [Pseudomonas]MBC2383800.1 hypothetical protein [Pseudomonas cremoris]
MKSFFSYPLCILSLLATQAFAQDQAANVQVRQLSASLIAGTCDALYRVSELPTGNDHDAAKTDASNLDLHRCQYIRESVDCMGDNSCPSYEQWTQDNVEISPELPRDAFLIALKKRETTLNSGGK